MKANIFSNTNLIGTTELQVGDESRGCLYGVFLPTNYYFEHTQKYVWKFLETNKPNFEFWNSLRINVQLENGYFVFPQGGITFDDLSNLSHESLKIDIIGVDRHVINDFFHENLSIPFLKEPWTTISIEQKITFEDELRKEIGLKSNETSFFGFFKSKHKAHILTEFVTSALGKFQSNDDVLFVTKNTEISSTFAVVHLTWKGEKESRKFPSVHFYENFEEFCNLRMKVDISEWNE